MSEALDELFLFGEEKMEKAITQLHREFAAVRSNRANPLILDRVLVEYCIIYAVLVNPDR